MHAIVVIFDLLICSIIGSGGWFAYRAFERFHFNVRRALQAEVDAVLIVGRGMEDIHEAIQRLLPHVVAMRGTLDSVVRSDTHPATAAIEAPQVPKPHGEAKTLVLLNADRTVAHEVTWHRDVPAVYSYGGRVFERIGDDMNAAGHWEFVPC